MLKSDLQNTTVFDISGPKQFTKTTVHYSVLDYFVKKKKYLEGNTYNPALSSF